VTVNCRNTPRLVDALIWTTFALQIRWPSIQFLCVLAAARFLAMLAITLQSVHAFHAIASLVVLWSYSFLWFTFIVFTAPAQLHFFVRPLVFDPKYKVMPELHLNSAATAPSRGNSSFSHFLQRVSKKTRIQLLLICAQSNLLHFTILSTQVEESPKLTIFTKPS
jgi:hypothetical protein